MKRWMMLSILACMLLPFTAMAETPYATWQLQDEKGRVLTVIAEEPQIGDCYITADNRQYEVVSVAEGHAVAEGRGAVALPDVSWLRQEEAVPVVAMTRRIGLYCTHSDESYEPSDGFYTTNGRGTIYEVAAALAQSLNGQGAEATVAQALHHPHDAGAYRRSRQTAAELLRQLQPDCLLDVHRDGIPDPASYAVTIAGKEASKVRLLVGRGNQNAEANREFALLIKAVADRVYPGLIKDIYMGRGAFNQDLYPRSLLLECGTYTLEKERVLRSMPMMADVLTRALYGGVTGSAGRTVSDVTGRSASSSNDAVPGQRDYVPATQERGAGMGTLMTVGLLAAGLVGYAVLSAGSWRSGKRKAARNLSEMTGGLIGRKPEKDENPQHS